MKAADVCAESHMSCYVYLLECRDGTLYCGWTTDMQARLAEHQAGRGARYTRARLPLRLAYWEELASAGAARRREAAVKKLRRPAKLALVAGHSPAQVRNAADAPTATAQPGG